MVINETVVNFIGAVILIQSVLLVKLLLIWINDFTLPLHIDIGTLYIILIIPAILDIFILFLDITGFVGDISSTAWRLNIVALGFYNISHIWSAFEL